MAATAKASASALVQTRPLGVTSPTSRSTKQHSLLSPPICCMLGMGMRTGPASLRSGAPNRQAFASGLAQLTSTSEVPPPAYQNAVSIWHHHETCTEPAKSQSITWLLPCCHCHLGHHQVPSLLCCCRS